MGPQIDLGNLAKTYLITRLVAQMGVSCIPQPPPQDYLACPQLLQAKRPPKSLPPLAEDKLDKMVAPPRTPPITSS